MAGYFTKLSGKNVYQGRFLCGNVALENGDAVTLSNGKVVATTDSDMIEGIIVESKHKTHGQNAITLRFVQAPGADEIFLVENGIEKGLSTPWNSLDYVIQPNEYVRMRRPQAGDVFELIINDTNADAFILAYEGQAVKYYADTLVVPFVIRPGAEEVISLTGFAAFSSAEGATSGDTLLEIDTAFAAPTGYEWQYILDDDEEDVGKFGTALVGGTTWTDSTTDIASGGKKFAHLVLVKSADDKPYYTVTLDVVAAE